ncbi:MAG: VWA domain-containing protein [Polyangiaceae bacterium]
MSFVAWLALGIGVLVVAPYLAHRLRRKRADSRLFAAAHLVPPAPPRARRRSSLEDVALFSTRALAVLALALLGASPLVRCSRLSLQRSSGASVALAIVIDDSMSMRAKAGNQSRFERARDAARELLASAREGDAVAIVMAGAPARVALAATTDLGAARALVDAMPPSDRATDLDSAVALARGLVAELPQIDRRVVLLSDMADGDPDGAPLGEGSSVPLWAPLTDIREPASDCAVLAADRTRKQVRARIVCSHDANAAGRDAVVYSGDDEIARAHVPLTAGSDAIVTLPNDPTTALVLKLSGEDAIASDDAAPVVLESGPGTIAVVADAAEETAVTGGPPVVEQALSALKGSVAIRPIPIVPDRADDLASFIGILIDDPPGFTPEQRHALADFLKDGGAVLVALGPKSAAAPLGATLQPLVDRNVSWTENKSDGADVTKSAARFSDIAGSLANLGAARRASLTQDDLAALELLIPWKDGAPLVARRTIGRGEVELVTLPFNVDASDFPLRPGFLSLLDAWEGRVLERSSPRRQSVGTAWTFPAATSVRIDGPGGPLAVVRDGDLLRAEPSLIGAYQVAFSGGKTEQRVAAPVTREIDLRPRRVAESASTSSVGTTHSQVDASWVVALGLLGLVAFELVLRVRAAQRPVEELA